MKHHQIQYIEFLSQDFAKTKRFYTGAFGWEFTDWGEEYIAFAGDCVEGGFAKGTPQKGNVLVILYSKDLEKTRELVMNAEGEITKDIFSFPGGRRFHFTDPHSNELGVWSDK